MKEYLLFLLLAVLWDLSGQPKDIILGETPWSLSMGVVLSLVHTNMWWANCILVLRVIAEAINR